METETKTAKIIAVEKPKHPLYINAEYFRVVTVEIDGRYLYEFSQVRNLRNMPIDNTVIWKNYDTQDPFNWDGKAIGNADLSVQGWLASQGYAVSWETPV